MSPDESPYKKLVDDLVLRMRLEVYSVLFEMSDGRFISFRNGTWFCKESVIDFPDRSAIYATLLSALYFCPSPDGLCRYEMINAVIERSGEEKLTDRTAQIKRIHNALITLYRSRKGQKFPFPKIAPDGNDIIRVESNRGLIFYNPKLR